MDSKCMMQTNIHKLSDSHRMQAQPWPRPKRRPQAIYSDRHNTPPTRWQGPLTPQVMAQAAPPAPALATPLQRGWETVKGVVALGSFMWTTLLLFSLAS